MTLVLTVKWQSLIKIDGQLVKPLSRHVTWPRLKLWSVFGSEIQTELMERRTHKNTQFFAFCGNPKHSSCHINAGVGVRLQLPEYSAAYKHGCRERQHPNTRSYSPDYWVYTSGLNHFSHIATVKGHSVRSVITIPCLLAHSVSSFQIFTLPSSCCLFIACLLFLISFLLIWICLPPVIKLWFTWTCVHTCFQTL